MRHLPCATALALWAAIAGSAVAQPITLQYQVSITERANVVPIGTTPVDQRINLSLGPAEPYASSFLLSMTFELQAGHSSGTEFTLHYGEPTFSAIPLARAVPLILPSDLGAEIDNNYGSTVEQQAMRPDGSSFRSWGAYRIETVRRAGDVQSGSTALFTHIRPATFAGEWEFERDIPLAAYLSHMQEELEFDFTTWSYFYPAGGFTADSYNYRGTAQFNTPIPEPSTYLLMLVGLAAIAAAARRARGGRVHG